MKTLLACGSCLVVVAGAFAIANLLFGVGIGVYRLPGPSERFHSVRGVARGHTGTYDVNIERMIPFMRDAKWTTGHFLWKLPVKVELEDGERFEIDALGYFFQVEGVRGTFYLDGAKQEEFEKVCFHVIRR